MGRNLSSGREKTSIQTGSKDNGLGRKEREIFFFFVTVLLGHNSYT